MLRFIQVGDEFVEQLEDGDVFIHTVITMVARYGEGEQYRIAPVDPKGTDEQGYTVSFVTDADSDDEHVENLGVFMEFIDAELFANQHNDKRADEPDPNDTTVVPEH